MDWNLPNMVWIVGGTLACWFVLVQLNSLLGGSINWVAYVGSSAVIGFGAIVLGFIAVCFINGELKVAKA
jgi:hypothetical protein